MCLAVTATRLSGLLDARIQVPIRPEVEARAAAIARAIQYDYDSSGNTAARGFGGVADVAVQPGLGILSERRVGFGAYYSGDLVAYGADLVRGGQ